VIIVKVAIVGDSQIGKTTLMVKYIEDKFDEEFIETLGLNVMEKSFELKNCVANLQIYDLGGQRQFAELMPTALEGTKAVIFAFNLVQKASLISVKRWYKDARKLNKMFKPILVGTKYDLFEQKDKLFKGEMIKMARTYAENMHSPLICCSSKTSTNVKQVFTIVVGSVFQIKIKSKQKSEDDEAILEYDVIYKKHKKKKDKHKKDKSKKKKKKDKKKKRKKDKKAEDKSSSSDSHSDSENSKNSDNAEKGAN
jgi:GTP-binding protein of the ras superfamily involved in termination of M-phase